MDSSWNNLVWHHVGHDNDLDRRQGLDFQEVAPTRRSFPPPPRFLFGHAPAAVNAAFYREQVQLRTGVFGAHQVEVAACGLLSRGATLFGVQETLTQRSSFQQHARMHGTQYPLSPGMTVDQPVVLLIGPGHDVYGHWLVDFLPKLYLLGRQGIAPAALPHLVPDILSGFGKAWLALLGVGEDRLIAYPSKAGCVARFAWVPSLLRTNSRTGPLFATAIQWLRDSLRAAHPVLWRPVGTPGALFVSRATTERNRHLRNRPEVEAVAAEMGFTLFHPEKHDLLTQVSVFASASCIAGDYGSALHGSVFAREGTPVCALRWDREEPGWLQSGLGEALGHPTGYVLGPADGEGGWTLDPRDVRAGLRAVRDLAGLH